MSNLIFNEIEKTIAFRYIKSRRSEGFISIAAWFSLIGITLGVATLIVVMSVMNGFRTELVDRILGINGHLIVYNKNKPEISLDSRVDFSWAGEKQSYSIAYPGLKNSTFSKALIFFKLDNCTDSGRLVE